MFRNIMMENIMFENIFCIIEIKIIYDEIFYLIQNHNTIL